MIQTFCAIVDNKDAELKKHVDAIYALVKQYHEPLVHINALFALYSSFCLCLLSLESIHLFLSIVISYDRCLWEVASIPSLEI